MLANLIFRKCPDTGCACYQLKQNAFRNQFFCVWPHRICLLNANKTAEISDFRRVWLHRLCLLVSKNYDRYLIFNRTKYGSDCRIRAICSIVYPRSTHSFNSSSGTEMWAAKRLASYSMRQELRSNGFFS